MTQVEYISAQSVPVYFVRLHSVPVHSYPARLVPGQYVRSVVCPETVFKENMGTMGPYAGVDYNSLYLIVNSVVS